MIESDRKWKWRKEGPYVSHVSADEQWFAPSLSYRVHEEVDIRLRVRHIRVPRLTKIVTTIQEK